MRIVENEAGTTSESTEKIEVISPQCCNEEECEQRISCSLQQGNVATDILVPNPRNARTHSKKQVRQIASSVEQFGFNNPILVDEKNVVIAGHGRLLAAQHLGLKKVPVVHLHHMTDAQKRAYILADNKIAMNAGWDSELLAVELGELADLLPEIDLNIEVTGFDTGEVDVILLDFEEQKSTAKEDDLPEITEVAVTQQGDVWQLGPHRILCGDSRNADAIKGLFEDQVANVVITDPPYNVKVQGHVGGRGKTKHDEFAFASGEMSDQEFETFLTDSMTVMINHLEEGALLYAFMDWRHIEVLLKVGRELGLIHKNLCVWNKSAPGQGAFYRSAHELVGVFAKTGAVSTNNVQLGRYGRNRTNVWNYPSVNTFQTGKGDDFALHPTVKPVAMIADAIKDASKRGEIVFDPFLGSGTAVLAAEKVGRRCYGVEYEPKYIDVSIRRWQAVTGKDALLIQSSDAGVQPDQRVGGSFDELLNTTSKSNGEEQ